MNNFISKLNGLVWTLAGTGLVLITLSGETKFFGLVISAVALTINIVGMMFESDN